MSQELMASLRFDIGYLREITIFLYVFTFLFILVFGYSILVFVVFLISSLLLIPVLPHERFFKWICSLSSGQALVLLFVLALVMRVLMVVHTRVVTPDIDLMIFRSQQMMAGNVPYEDFSVNKPPMYLYLGYALGQLLGPSNQLYRLFFIVVDGFNCILIYKVARLLFKRKEATLVALIYAISPLAIVMFGIEGHYDPVVILCVLGAFHTLLKKRYLASGLLLGLGFALKLYPIFLLPFFLQRMGSWRDRILHVTVFSIPMVLSYVPMLMISPDALYRYLFGYQTGRWMDMGYKSFYFSAVTIFDADHVLGIRISDIIMAIFVVMIGIMFLSYAYSEGSKFDSIFVRYFISRQGSKGKGKGRRKGGRRAGELKDRLVMFWYKVILVVYLIYLGVTALTFLIPALRDQGFDTGPVIAMGLVTLGMYSMAVLLFLRYRMDRIIPERLDGSPTDRLILYSIFSIMLLLLGSPNNCPHYILWFFPLLLLVRNRAVMYVLLWVGVWNFPGTWGDLLPRMGL